MPTQAGKVDIIELHRRYTKHLFPPFSTQDVRFLALALAGEVGELCNFVKKEWRDGVDYDKEIRDEIADCRVYLELLAECFGLGGDKLDAQVQDKLQRVMKRFDDARAGEAPR